MATISSISTTEQVQPKRTRSPWQLALRRLVRHRSAMTGLIIIVGLIILAIIAPLITPFDPIKVDPINALYSPGLPYLFGTDQYGRDIFSRLIVGTRISLMVGLVAVGIATLIGVTIGLIAGFYGGWIDTLLMRVIDVMLAFPNILLALVIVSILGPNLTNLMIAVGVSAIPTYARLTRASVLGAREELYVEAARALGVPQRNIILRHILPNIIAPLIVAATLGVGTAILSAAALSFLGLGSQPPTPEWGRMLSEGRQYLRDQWWIASFPGLAIMLTVLAMNLLGDGLRDALDPRLKR